MKLKVRQGQEVSRVVLQKADQTYLALNLSDAHGLTGKGEALQALINPVERARDCL